MGKANTSRKRLADANGLCVDYMTGGRKCQQKKTAQAAIGVVKIIFDTLPELQDAR